MNVKTKPYEFSEADYAERVMLTRLSKMLSSFYKDPENVKKYKQWLKNKEENHD